MAYLPTVNELSTDRSKKTESAFNIVNSLSGRMNLTSSNKSVIAPVEKTNSVESTESTVGSSDKTTDVLTKLYDFIVKDYSQKDLQIQTDSIENEEYDDNAKQRELGLLQIIPQLMGKKDEEDKEGILSKLWRYFKYLSFGKMIYNNWDKISKLLGLEKLTESVKNLAEEFGITGIINNIKNTIDDIMSNFISGKPGLIASGDTDVEKIMATIRKRESGGNYSIKTKMGGTASGAYQFTDSTWQSVAKKVPGASKYNSAYQAPQEVQDAVARKYVEDILKESGGDVGAVPRKWYTGNIQGKMSAKAIAQNRGLTSEKYEAGFMKDLASQGFSATKSTPPTETKSESPSVPSSAQPNKEEKPVFSVAPKKDAFETKSAVDNVFSATTKNITVDTKTPSAPKTPTDKATRVSKKESEPGEVGSNGNGQIQKKESPTGIATENDLKGLQFENHGSANPLSLERQLTKFQADKLQQLMQKLGVNSLHINSGRRSKSYNATLEGAAVNSEHLNGRATDISTRGMTDAQRVQFVKTASSIGFGGIGVYGTFIHLDTGKVRTWLGKGVKVSSDMQGVLWAHQSGRLGKETDTSKISPGINEPGELSSAQQSTHQSQPPSKPRSLMEMAVESYKDQVQMVNNLLSPEGIKKLEEGLINFVQNVPKKETFRPDFGSMVQQNNYVLNNVQEQRLILQNSSPLQSDLPQLLQQFLNEHQ